MPPLNPQVASPLFPQFTPTIAANAKAAGDCVGNAFQLSVKTPFSSGEVGPIGIVQSAMLTDLDGLAPRLAIQIYRATFTDAGDAVAFAPGASAPGNYAGTILVNPTDWLVLGGVGYATVSAYGLASRIVNATWYAQIVSVDGFTVVTPNSIQGALAGIIS